MKVLAIWILASSPQIQAAEFYVSVLTGQDSNSGLTAAAPFRTLNKGRDSASAGDTVYVMNGTYQNGNYGSGKTTNNGVVFTIRGSGNATDGYITYKNYADHSPKIQFDGAGGIRFDGGVEYVIIDGIDIQGPSADITYTQAYAKRQERAGLGPDTGDSDNYYNGRGIFGWGPHRHIIIRNCEVYDTPSSGIRFNDSDHITIEDCTVGRTCWWTSSASSAIVFAETVAVDDDNTDAIKMIFRRNVVYDNWNRIPFYTATIPDNASPPRADYGTPAQDYILDGQGIYVTRSDPNYIGTFLMENNFCMNNGKNGINFDHSDSATAIIRHNTLYHNGSHNFIQTEHDGPNRVAGISASDIASAKIVNNIVVVRPPAIEITEIICRGDSGANLNNSYFEIQGSNGRHRFWYNVDNNGSAPSNLGGGVRMISISSGDSAQTVASATCAIINALGNFTATVSEETVTVNDQSLADRMNITDGGNTGHTVSVLQQGMGLNEYHALTTWDNSLVNSDYNLIFNGSYGGQLSAGANDLVGAPLFINPSVIFASADFSLQEASPALNSALATSNNTSTEDFEQTPRPIGGIPDRGALESPHTDNLNAPPSWNTSPFNRPDAIAGQDYSRFIRYNVFDPEDDAITFSIVSGPTWLEIDNDSGKITGNPNVSDAGLNIFTISISDGFNPPVETTMNIEVVSLMNTPSFSNSSITRSDAIECITYSNTIAGSATDADGDSLIYSKVSGPSWLSIAANGDLSGTPGNSDPGVNMFTVEVSDGALTDTGTLNITVIDNASPYWKNTPFNRLDATIGQPYSRFINYNITEPDDEALIFNIVSGPSWLKINTTSGKVSGTPAASDVGTNVFMISISDTCNPPDEATMNIEVLPDGMMTWSTHYNLNNTNNSLEDDSNSDGKPNFYHFAFDSDPLAEGGRMGNALITTHTRIEPDANNQQAFLFTFPARSGSLFSGDPLTTTIDGITYTIYGGTQPLLNNIPVVLYAGATPSFLPALGNYDGDAEPDYEYYTAQLSTPDNPKGFIWIEVSLAE